MIKMPIADDGDRVQAYRVGVDFTVAARSGSRPCGWWAFRGDCLGAYRSLPVMAATV